MALIKIKNWKSPNIDVYAMTPRKDIQANAVSLEWLASKEAEQIGTTLNEELWEELQVGIAQLVFDVDYSNNNYIATLKGLNTPLESEFIPLFNGLEIKLKIPKTNTLTSPHIILNGHNIQLKKFDENGNIIDIVAGELVGQHIYNFIYHAQGHIFICRELSLLNTQAINSILARLKYKIDEVLENINTNKNDFTHTIGNLTLKLQEAVNSSYIESEHYKKSDIDRLLNLKVDNVEFNNQIGLKANIQGDNITRADLFRNNINVYSKDEVNNKILELSPRPNTATRFSKGVVMLDTVYKIIDEVVVPATDTTQGKLSKNDIKQIISQVTPNIKVASLIDILRSE